VVKLLMSKGANIYAQSDYGRTCLHCAAAEGHLAVVETLVEANVDVLVQNKVCHHARSMRL
jgi:ankyrin repeat protein